MANEYLQRTPTSTGNAKVFTWSGWVKRNALGSFQGIFSATSRVLLVFTDQDKLRIGTQSVDYEISSATFRDVGSWMHILLAIDTTLSSGRYKVYVNGITVLSGVTNLSINADVGPTTSATTNFDYAYSAGQTVEGESFDVFFIDGQALTPDVFGFYKEGDGYVSAGSTQATDFRPGQWVPKRPRIIKTEIERRGGFGVNGFYLPMNDSSNPGADFHCTPNSIITLKGEDLPQPRNGAPTTTDAYVSQLRQEVSTLGFDGVVKFDGDGDYLSLSTTSDFAFGTGDFTIEFWAWVSSADSSTLQPVFDNDYNSAGGLAIAIRHSDSRIFVGDSGSGLNLCQFNAPFALNSWNHFAVVADSGTYKAFVNGTSCSLGSGSATVVNTSRSSGTTEIGRLVGQTGIDAKKFISNLRVVKGTALYTTNFTAPTEPLTDVTNTKLLCCNSTKAPESATVAPTIGTYVQNWTENTSSGLDSYNGIGAIYDGQLGTSNRGGNSSSHDGSYETLFDGQSVAVSSTIEIYWNGVGSGQRVIRVNGTTEINGGSGALTPGWDSHSFSGTVTKLEVKTANTGSYGISAVRIDSNILTTPLTANGNAFATRNELTGSISLAVPGISTSTSANLISNGTFDSSDISDWVTNTSSQTWVNGQLQVTRSGGGGATTYKTFTTEVGKRYTVLGTVNSSTSRGDINIEDGTGWGGSTLLYLPGTNGEIRTLTGSFTAASTTTTFGIGVDVNGGIVFIDNIEVKQEDVPRDYSADIKGSGTNKVVQATLGNGGIGYELGGYYGSAINAINNNCGHAFSGADSAFVCPGDFTVEFWLDPVVATQPQGNPRILGQTNNSGGKWDIYIDSTTSTNRIYTMGGTVALTGGNGSSYGNFVPGQWNHFCLERHGSIMTTYMNGVAVYTQTYTNTIGTTDFLYLGSYGDQISAPGFGITGKIQDFRFYKGVAKYKGGFDVPKPYTPVGFEGDSWRTTADTCKNNFATLNPLIGAGFAANDNVPALKDGNLYYDNANQSWTTSTIGVSSGKYYAEFMVTGGTLASNLGVCGDNRHGKNNQNYHAARGISYIRLNNPSVTKDYNSTSVTETSNDAPLSYESGSIVGITIDFDNKEIKYYKNGTLIRTDSTPASYTPVDFAFYFLAFRTNDAASPLGSNWSDVIANFGQNPSFSGQTTAGTNTDDSGKGLFKYAPPSGFLALCEDNLSTPAIADPGEYFKTVLWTGDGSSGRSITGVGFQPDLVWIKKRSTNASHCLVDSVRGATLRLKSDTTTGDLDESVVKSFDNNGFTVSIGSGGETATNSAGDTFVAWCWKAGGAAVSNTDGSITSQVSANQTAGFSIVSYTGSGANATVGHGLGKAPNFIVVKSRTSARDWVVYHSQTGETEYGLLNGTGQFSTASTFWNDTSPTSSVFSVGTALAANASTENLIAYCWAEIEGFSKFGSYVGNQSADGPFVYCGFKPAWLMVKNTDTGSTLWLMADSSRFSTNPINGYLHAESNADEYGPLNGDAAYTWVDFLSNGFKLRETGDSLNKSGDTYIFAAFAESPFQTANAK